MVRRVGRVLVLTVGLPAPTPTLLLKAVCATLATNIGGINYCVTDNLGICRVFMVREFCACDVGYSSAQEKYWTVNLGTCFSRDTSMWIDYSNNYFDLC